MLDRTWLDALKLRLTPTLNRRQRRAAGEKGLATRRLRLESLEERRVLAFAAPVDYGAGASPQALVSADFNNDTVLDLAVANYGSSDVSVLLGDGLGGFGAKTDFATGANPLSVAVGDVNGDGTLDLATANAYDVSVMLGNGDGTFGAPSSYGVVGNPQSVAVGDFNGDGLLDLGVTSNEYTPGYYGYWGWYPGYNTAYANVLVGNGGGSFSGPNATFIDYYASANSALAADLNSDIYDDFVTFDSNGYVVVLMGDGSGYLQVTGYFYTGDYSYGVAAGDVNGDLDNDLVAANFNGNGVGVLLGDGLGGFSGPVNYDAGSSPISIVLGDFTGDGNLDVATSNYYTDQVSVLYGGGNGTFSTPTLSATGSLPYAIVTGYFDGDISLDAATANLGNNTVSVLINDTVWPPPPPPPPSISIGDVTVTEGDSGTAPAGFIVTRSGNPDITVTVNYTTANGDALAGSDYVITSGTLTFDPGVMEMTIPVPVIGDLTNENDEILYVNLSGATGANIIDSVGEGTILDNDPPATLSIGDVTVTEGDSGTVPAVFTVTRGGNLAGNVTVNYSTANGDALAGNDYVFTSGTLTFGPGVTELTIPVPVNGDLTDEFDQTFRVNLSAASGANIIDGQGVGTITDNDPPPTITITAKVSANEGKNNATTPFNFIVTLSAASEKEVRVNFATANGTATTGDNDYVANSGTLIFAPGVTSQTISVVVRGDKRKESTETFFVNLSGATNATIGGGTGLGEIMDDDTPSRGKP